MKIPLTEKQFWVVFIIAIVLIGLLFDLHDPCEGLTGDAEWECDYKQARREYYEDR